jgi:hypothetical protein
MSQLMWGPALEAEVQYRQEQARKAYTPGRLQRGTRAAWNRARSWAQARHHDRSRAAETSGGDAVELADEALDGLAAPSDVLRLDEVIRRRAAQIEEALDALRPRDGLNRRIA